MDLLIAQIRNAFRNTSFPGNDDLTDSFGEEAEALVAEFCDKTNWAQLDAGFLNQAPDGWGSALSFFSGRALRFYLPAYLIADIEAKLVNPDPATRLCVFVTPMMEKKRIAKVFGSGTLGDCARQDFKLFEIEEVSVIVAYLCWKLERDGYNPTIEQALENYWLAREAELKKALRETK